MEENRLQLPLPPTRRGGDTFRSVKLIERRFTPNAAEVRRVLGRIS
jgi:hypothetical protein